MGLFKEIDRHKVFDKSGGMCWYCGLCLEEWPKETHGNRVSIQDSWGVIDHVLPKHLGGKTVYENLVPSWWLCNHRKSKNSVEEFRGIMTRIIYGLPRFSEAQIEYLKSVGLILPKYDLYVFAFEKEGWK